MQFKGRFEVWRVVFAVALVVLAWVLFGSDVARVLRGEVEPSESLSALVAVGVSVIAAIELVRTQPMLRARVDLDDTALVAVLGRKTYRIPYALITEVRITHDRFTHRGVPVAVRYVMVRNDVEDLFLTLQDESGFISEFETPLSEGSVRGWLPSIGCPALQCE